VEGLRLIGVPDRQILGREVLPNLVPAVLVQFLLAVSIAVFAEGGLSYLGLGAPAPTPTLGNLIAEAGSQLLDGAWWYALLPGLVLVVGITGVNLLADAATDVAIGDQRPPPEPSAAATDLTTTDTTHHTHALDVAQ
jgi:peptide/nickel transport system permease protein